MKLEFSQYLSAKMREDVRLTVFPAGQPEDFVTSRNEKPGGESEATTTEYDFPDNSVVIAEMESGGAVIDPEEDTNLLIEVHIGPQANETVVSMVSDEARKLAAAAGISETQTSDTKDSEQSQSEIMDPFWTLSGLQFIQH